MCSMPCVARVQHPHRQKLVAGYPFVPLDVAMSHVGCKELVFRGDAARDEDSQAAVLDELAASAPTSLGGLNLVSAFGLLDGHAFSTLDCINSYVQSNLDSSCPTYVLLPAELVPDYARHIHQLVAPLIHSLYGHPLASASWQNHLSNILSTHLAQLLSLPFFEFCTQCLC